MLKIMGKSNSTLAREVEKLKKDSIMEKRNEQSKIEALEQKHDAEIQNLSENMKRLQRNNQKREAKEACRRKQEEEEKMQLLEKVEKLEMENRERSAEGHRTKEELKRVKRHQKRDRDRNDEKEERYLDMLTKSIERTDKCISQQQENNKRVDSLVTEIQANSRRLDRRFAAMVGVMNEVKRSVEIGAGYPTCLDESYQVGEVPGDALIINNMIFHEAESRTGSAHDAKKLRDLFRMLNIRVQVAEDFTVAQIKNKINEFSSSARGDFTILCILSHGSGNGVMGVEGDYLKYEDLWVPFTRTQNLKGKPKVFIIQACGGNRVMGRFADASPHLTFDPPTHSDILFASSTVAGYVSYRRPDEKGSFFIEELVSVIKQRYRKEHLEDMITAAINNVIKSIGPNHYQVPVKTTTLRKKLYLPPPAPAVMAREGDPRSPRRQGRVAIGRQLEMR